MKSALTVFRSVVLATAATGCGDVMSVENTSVASASLSIPDATHNGVRSLVFINTAGNVRQLCSGVLISPTVFLTAGHCTSHPLVAAGALITFDAQVTNAATLVTGTAYTAPDFNLAAFNINSDTHDVGVVVLDAPVTGRNVSSLPTAGLLNQLRPEPGTPITAVGYGVDQNGASGGGVVYVNDMTRDSGTLTFRALTAFITADQVKADGVCFGDSGGPDFMMVNGHEQLVAVSVVVNGFDCNEVAWLYRLDEPATRAFLGRHVTLP